MPLLHPNLRKSAKSADKDLSYFPYFTVPSPIAYSCISRVGPSTFFGIIGPYGALLRQPCPVIAILVLPGWKVERKGKGAVNVLSAKELLSYFRGEHRKPRLDPATAKGVIALLDQRCRDVRY